MKVKERFLRYAATDTASEPDSPKTPSTDKQRVFAEMLCDELRGMGAEDVKITDNAYVYARIPSNVKRDIPKIGFIAHLDTAPAVSGTGVKPRVFENYDGGTLEIGNGVSIRPEEFCHLSNYIGQDIITSSGDTLLGADDEAGIAEIMELCEILLCDKSIEHGEIGVAFTPDEEIGHGAALLDIEGFGCKYAYTVDGGALGELEYENFNAAQAEIRIKGVSIHPGDAKGKMKNALLIANELVSKFPVEQTPAKTEGYEGFFHFDELNATVESAKLVCIIRDHDAEKFSAKKQFVQKACREINDAYGDGTAELVLKDSYRNMREKILPHMHLIENAKKSMENAGVKPVVVPIRGGTDGAQLSFRGLPCPNLCTGGHNFHGLKEYIPVQSMEKTVEILLGIVRLYAKSDK